MPPAAASAGKVAWATVDSSPRTSSRLISSPTRKKNTAIRPSLIHSSSGLSSASGPTRTPTGVSRNRLYSQDSGELSISSAASAAAISTSPPAAS